MKIEAKIDKYVNGNTKGIKIIPRSPQTYPAYRDSNHNQNRDTAITNGKAKGKQKETEGGEAYKPKAEAIADAEAFEPKSLSIEWSNL